MQNIYISGLSDSEATETENAVVVIDDAVELGTVDTIAEIETAECGTGGDVSDIDADQVDIDADQANDGREQVDEAPGFDLGAFRYEGPFPEPEPEEADCTVYNGGAGVTALSLLKEPYKPLFIFRREIWEEVQYLVHLTPHSELAVFLICKQYRPLTPKHIAVDLFFPDQEVGAGGVAISGDKIERFYKDLNQHPDFKTHMHSRLAHLHSHAGMSVFWSEADTNQQMSRDDLGFYDHSRFYLVVNTRNEVRCSFVTYQPLLRRFDNLPVVVIGKPVELTEERKAELSKYVEERSHSLTCNVFCGIKTFSEDLTENYVLPAPGEPFGWEQPRPYVGGYAGDYADAYDAGLGGGFGPVDRPWRTGVGRQWRTGFEHAATDGEWGVLGKPVGAPSADKDTDAVDLVISYLDSYGAEYETPWGTQATEVDDYVRLLETYLNSAMYLPDESKAGVAELLYNRLYGVGVASSLVKSVVSGALVLADEADIIDAKPRKFGESVLDFAEWVHSNYKQLIKYKEFVLEIIDSCDR